MCQSKNSQARVEAINSFSQLIEECVELPVSEKDLESVLTGFAESVLIHFRSETLGELINEELYTLNEEISWLSKNKA